MHIIACIEDPAIISKILNHLQEKSSLDSGVLEVNKKLNCVPILPDLMQKGVYLSYTHHGGVMHETVGVSVRWLNGSMQSI